ncbi:transporter substrate-binding domain-containing protein [Corynebacterium poyangense]|uniref:Transporter substrate-binding domain-containing protein n=1 Tax=Corynebacterium poyangense TaxID=2684405 RepID=A0A7H0SRC0_9CORY|nr:glutamate ABC transporter substrate-binding protein [Corynebacterium poyangense]MBZ8176529.1 transporter substrate-binding domain-containing protein [Corynebacterium poyangense]QNQ91095.1 transporter substrate-binding domain-containing protein [Corynebacterium poyangense]
MRIFLCLAAVLLGLTACSSPPDTTEETPPAPLHKQLPLGAAFEEPGAVEPHEIDTDHLLPSQPADPYAPIDSIIRRGRLVVGVDQSQYLLSFRDPALGEQRGFEVDLAHEIARDIFHNPKAVEFRYVDSADRTSVLQNNTVDLVIRTVSITRDRQEKVLFSEPYLWTNTRLAALRGSGISSIADVSTETLCTTGNSIALEEARRRAPGARKLVVRNWSDCLLALQQHQADAIIGDDRILAGIQAQDPYVVVLSESLHHDQYGVSAALSNESIIRRVNATLARIHADGTWDRMYTTWFGSRES